MIIWSWPAGVKFQPVQPRQISPYDYMWKLNFVLARRESFPLGIWLDLHAFSWDFSLYRSSRPDVLLEILQYSQENTRPEVCNFIKIETMAQIFSCEFCEIFKNVFSYRTPPVAAAVCKRGILQNWRFIDFHWFKNFLLELFSLQLCLFFFIK